MCREINIGSRKIGDKQPPFIIAEAGINHNGDLETALKMVAVAKNAGADAIKFQTFKAEEFVSESSQQYTYVSQGREVTESMLEMFRRHELSTDAWFEIKKECNRLDIIFLSTPQNLSDLNLLMEVGIPAIKIGSDDFTNLPLLSSFSKTGLPLLLSCGMADLAEIDLVLESVGALQGYPIVLLLCTSQYPAPPQDVNLARIRTLKQRFCDLVIGLSDHTIGSVAAAVALGLGACLFEKHFTLSHDLEGPDHWFSAEPSELKHWVETIRMSYILLGSDTVAPTLPEFEMRKAARRSVTAIEEILQGSRLTEMNVGLRRPGVGVPASDYNNVLGRKATRSIAAGSTIFWGDLD